MQLPKGNTTDILENVRMSIRYCYLSQDAPITIMTLMC